MENRLFLEENCLDLEFDSDGDLTIDFDESRYHGGIIYIYKKDLIRLRDFLNQLKID